MRFVYINILFSVVLVNHLFGQSGNYFTNKAFFEEAKSQWSAQYWDKKAYANAFALEKNIPVVVSYQGSVMVLEEIDQNGIAVYRMLYNFGASRFLGTDLVRPRASLALNLEGTGMTVGVWDGDNFQDNHIEFGNRAETRGSISDEPLGLGGNHSTHVTGTIAASGINPAAKGMAPKADVFLYDFLNDKAEIASELAREEPLLVSNHSYGLVLGWQPNETGWVWRGDPGVSNTEDYRFGLYDNGNSRTLDEIAFNAPYYLHVRAAGNDRSDTGDGSRPPDGPYDCIGPSGVAKNVLTVGAIDYTANRYTSPQDVVMSAFSSWGPTDDGRIKPDIVGPGVNILSTIAEGNNEYGQQSGTSMAAPAISGSLILLQEQYSKSTGGLFMLASTLKGLIIHTAHEAGQHDGPDYEHGWGVMATDRASNFINSRDGIRTIMDEKVLSNGDSLVYTVSSDGNNPLVATISWTDVPGTPPGAVLDPTDLMLVNDLDVRIYDEDSNIFKPWILDPARPDRAATTGDNFRDNVEKAEIPVPHAGTYTIVVKHKGQLRNGRQTVSVLISTTSLDRDFTAFYWIGGSGAWNDGSNWSGRSGGAPINQAPGIENPVIFDQNSFSSSSNAINFTGNSSCYNINYYASEACAFILAGSTLNVNGTLNVDNDAVTIQGGTIRFTGVSSKMNYVRTGMDAFRTANLLFNSQNGTWNLQTDITANFIRVDNSNIISKNNSISVREFSAGNMNGNILDLSGSHISGVEIFSVDPGADAIFANTTILYAGDGSPTPATFNGGGKRYGRLINEGIELTVSGTNTFQYIANDGVLSLADDNTIDSLILTPGSALLLQAGSTQTINQHLSASGTPGDLIIISSGSSGAALFADNPNVRFCLDYLSISNVSVSGSTGFLTGYNSTLSNSNGWIEVDCADALFPSFDIAYPCAEGETQFIDTSTGGPQSWSWNFGDPQFPDRNESAEQNPSHRFNFTGAYTITYNVKNDLFDQTITRVIEVVESSGNLSRPSILVDGARLTSSVIAPNYQWYYNGTPIPDAEQRAYDLQQPGLYSVVISDDQCRFRSEETGVTGLDLHKQSLSGLSYYPNPVDNALGIKLNDNERGAVIMVLHNTVGAKVFEMTMVKSGEQFDSLLPMYGLPAGIYHLTVLLNDKRATVKIIKE
jgi:PKD repeat protein